MPTELQVLIRHIRRVASRRELANRPDRELLAIYARDRDEHAFTELVRRHAGLVAGVCRRVLRNEQDIEDVFQATFLILSRKARSVSWHESAANWLHSVAYHLAIRSRKIALRQQKLEREGQLQPALRKATSSPSQPRELQELLDQELTRLPEDCRSALILCYLEGRTRDQAARQSGLSLRTLDRRLELGRELLRERLARRGLDLSVIVVAAGLGESANASCAKLTSATVQFVMQQASLKIGVASSALKLARSALPSASVTSVKVVAAIILTMAVTVASVGIFCLTASSAYDSALDGNAKKSLSPQKDAKPAKPQPLFDLFGDSLPEGAVARLGGTRFRVGHPQMVAYSADGKLLFAGTQSGIRVFESTTGRLLRNLAEDWKTTCWTTGVSPDGKLVAVGGLISDPVGAIYESATGKCVCNFRGSGGQETRFGAFSPDGNLLATIASRSIVDLFDSRTGKLVRMLELEPLDQIHGSSSGFAILNVAFLPDGKRLLTATHGTGIIRIHDVQSGEELRRFIASPQGIADAVLSADGSRLAVLESDTRPSTTNYKPDLPGNKVMIFDFQAGRQIAEILSRGVVLGMAFTGDGKTLFTGKEGKDITMWDTATGKQKSTVPYPYTSDEWHGAMALAPDGKRLAREGTASVHVCDISTGMELECHPGHGESIVSVAVHPFDSIVATGACDGRLLLWDRNSGRMLRELLASTGKVNSVTYSPDGSRLFAIAEFKYEPRHSSIRCLDSANGKEVWRLDDHPIQPSKLAISPDGKILAAGGDAEVFLIDSGSGRPLRTLDTEGEKSFTPGFWGPSTCLGFTPEGHELLAWGNEKGIHHWNVTTGEHRVQASEIRGRFAIAFSPDRNGLIMESDPGHLNFVEVATGKRIRDIKAFSDKAPVFVTNATFSPDGRTLAWSGRGDGGIHLVDLNTGTERKQLPGTIAWGLSMSFSNDGKTLVTDCGDGTALVWSLK